VQTATVTGNVTTPQFGSSQINLNVTPRVANDGSVYVRLNLQRSVPVAFGNTTVAANRSVNTEVMVDSGSTIVIGGIYSGEEQSSSEGLPFFRKIPIIGKLFGAERETKTSSELMFFVTPRIVNPKRKDSPTKSIDLPVSQTVNSGGVSGR
jgi:type II secretory pathway component GspD/PulD (secretin)